MGSHRDMGVSLSTDDFGTGHSSLDHLTRLPVNVLEIDRSFVLNMSNDPADAMIVRSTRRRPAPPPRRPD